MSAKHFKIAPAEISYKNKRFLITKQPHDSTISQFIDTLKKHNVKHIVCATDRTYETNELEKVMILRYSKESGWSSRLCAGFPSWQLGFDSCMG